MTAVAVWDHLPTADELLDARIARGWEPTATGMRGGDQVLGHAACRVRLRVSLPEGITSRFPVLTSSGLQASGFRRRSLTLAENAR